MEEVMKKEIRLTYQLDNEEDKEIYEALKKNKQPGKVAKELISKAFYTTENNVSDINLKMLELIEKLADKIDNIQVNVVTQGQEEESLTIEDENEIEFIDEINIDDIDDIEF